MDTTTFHFEQFQAFSPFTEAGPYRAADYWKLPEGEPVELVRGRLIMSPSPNILHQVILGSLNRVFEKAEEHSGGLCLTAPMDVILSDDTILQPDVLYISNERRGIVGSRVEGPPDLVVEILSPGTDRRDKTEKLDLYAKYGVTEYWIVDPEAQCFEFLWLGQGRYTVLQPTSDVYRSPRLPEVEINLTAFWQEVDRRLRKS
jgi:Uma2 family endonuclease